MAGALNGAGDTNFTMLIRIVLSCLLFLPLAYFLIFVLEVGLQGAWYASMTYLIVLGLSFFFRFRQGKWKSIELEK